MDDWIWKKLEHLAKLLIECPVSLVCWTILRRYITKHSLDVSRVVLSYGITFFCLMWGLQVCLLSTCNPGFSYLKYHNKVIEWKNRIILALFLHLFLKILIGINDCKLNVEDGEKSVEKKCHSIGFWQFFFLAEIPSSRNVHYEYVNWIGNLVGFEFFSYGINTAKIANKNFFTGPLQLNFNSLAS